MRFRRRKGRVLAIKLGLNPNSSSLGVDVTFLLAGAALFSFATPVLSALVRWRAATGGPAEPAATAAAPDTDASRESEPASSLDPGETADLNDAAPRD